MTELLYYIVTAIEAVSSKLASKSEKGFRLQCPAHKGKNRNLFIADGDKRLIMTCHSQHCDPKDIMESVGLTISDVFYEKLNPQKAKEYKAKVTTRQLIEELNHELIIISLWVTDFSEGLYPRNGENDRVTCKQSFQRVQKALHFLESEL
jgi:hypothetical protein